MKVAPELQTSVWAQRDVKSCGSAVVLLITIKQISPSPVQSPNSEFYRTQESAGPSMQLSLDQSSLMVSGAAQSDRLQPGPTVQGPLTTPGRPRASHLMSLLE